MHSGPHPLDGPDDHHPRGGQSPLSAIADVADELATGMERLLDLVLEARAWGGTEAAVGMRGSEWMTLTARLPWWLVTAVEQIADRIHAIPEVAGLLRERVLTLDDVATFVRLTREMNGGVLARFDVHAAAHANRLTEQGRVHAWTGDITHMIDQLRAPGWADRQERRAADGVSLIIQQDFDGGGVIHAELDKLGLTTVATSLHDRVDSNDPTPVRQQRAHALVAMAEESLAGATSTATVERVDATAAEEASTATTSRPARPSMTVIVDLANATEDRFAHLLRVTGGRHTPTLSARLTDALASNAELLIQLTDGARPLAELKATDAIPAAVRRAVLARDRGCRFPNCGAHPSRVHVHHIVHRADGGTNDPDNLLTACDEHHLRAIHHHGWKPELDPKSGRATWTRGRQKLATMPNGHVPNPPRDELPDWLAPPKPPPPDHPPND